MGNAMASMIERITPPLSNLIRNFNITAYPLKNQCHGFTKCGIQIGDANNLSSGYEKQ